MQTTVSDDEIEWKEEAAPFYYLKYGPFTIATARPETKFGDKYVVMHPDDQRYAEYQHGQKIDLDWINGPITATILKDSAADMEFGTGVMTITPWHDLVDFEIAERHGLEKEQIIDFKGKLLPIAGEFQGIHIKKARPDIIKKLEQKGLLVKIDDKYTHRIATNSRGGGIIEPQIKEQWFVDVNKEFILSDSKIDGIPSGSKTTLKNLMRASVENRQINIIPEHFEKTYFHWINNLRDWCISRQIWYGHQIPVWYRGKEIYCGIQAPEGDGWEQESDTLDTWFSSGLWTFSTLGWPEKTKDLAEFHPTSVLETGYDIIFFWVARMILMSGYLLGDIPFKTVFLHGLVRDAEKQKMSKSKGNVIDPLELSDKYGTDALRFALIFSSAAGNDIPLAEDKIKGMKHFANKIWNIARFVLNNVDNLKINGEEISRPQLNLDKLTAADKQIISQLDLAVEECSRNIKEFRLHEAAQNVYQFAWHEFADVYIEASKAQLQNPELKEQTELILIFALASILKILHPFMPFLTEELWKYLKQPQLLIVTKW